MSIAHELHWTIASKPKFGKSTEHSGAKKGKGAWDTKKVAKKDSNKGRRAGGKQEIKAQTVGDESDGPFAGSAPLFKKAAAMHWTTAEPRPCYPSEEPVEDHCNDSISPPAPGGGDDMGDGGGEYMGEPDMGDMDYEGYNEPNAVPQGDSDYAIEREEVEKEWEGQDELRDADPTPNPGGTTPEEQSLEHQDYEGDEGPGGFKWSEDEGDDDAFELGEDPMENAGPRKQEEEPLVPDEPVVEAPPEEGKGKKGDFAKLVPRATFLSDDDPHQFWGQPGDHIQDALHKYVMPALQSPNPEVAAKAKDILMNGPKIGNYNKRDLADQMSDPKFYEGKSRQKVMRQVEREEGKPEGYLDAPTDEERNKMRDYFEFGGQERGPVI